MAYDITLIPGDGIGPELSNATTRVLEATGVKINWEVMKAGAEVVEEYGTPLPEHVLASVRKNRVAIKGPITTPVGSGFRSVNVGLRKALSLYACVRPCKTYPGVPGRYDNVDLVVVRENMEDTYAGIEYQKGSPEAAKLIEMVKQTHGETLLADTGFTLKVISATRSRAVVKFAFEYARKQKRHKVTAVHKANIMKFSDGLFLETAREVATQYPDIEFEDRIADNMNMQLVKDPSQFDVIVCPNLYGDLLSDLCAALVGGMGVAPGANLGDDYAVFEPTHGSAPKYAGLNKANPVSMMLSGVMMLNYLGETAAAQKLENAIAAVIKEGKNVTYDLKPQAPETAVGTAQVADAIIAKMKELS